MLYGKPSDDETKYLSPIFGSNAESRDIPKFKLNDTPIEPREAYELVSDELLDEGNSRLNLATFCQTYMEPEAEKLMAQSFEKNAIDKSEYPRTADIENRCVNIIADLWHAPKDEAFMGTSTIGSSEACMLGGMAMKFNWRKNAQKHGLDINAKKPNLVISSGYQVCWEKFCVYWDVELRTVPMDADHLSLDLNHVMDYVDDYTIGIVGILGITYSGRYDDIAGLDRLVEAHNQKTNFPVYIHVDAASGGFYTPFMEANLKWDFRLKNVISINASGHKYGLVYPGVGWVLWRDKQFLPEELVFKVSYLGGELPTMAINFSHSASQLIGQYYNFIRYGYQGYKAIHTRTHEVAQYLTHALEETALFDIVNDGAQLPVICYSQKPDNQHEWTLYDLSDRLLMKGWQVPAYPLPDDLSQTVVQRIVVRADFGMNMAVDFVQDFNAAIDELNQAHIVFHEDETPKKYGFTH
ncbi:glutamate decarboxylase [Secundilactobacillus paracollinoides]|uniref:Glutamate decarboxylase n=1 Tax=Secundilactobacillus paracollinoides TaxID=240427 RepID=A0A1B2J211_9LACO|nr:glutamate decarboxylase [Secundilactobacillus paracollinoides]ANZ62415.1 glutamate decarboxylase [Secundilactobacillus paracollinoides]ANZ65502.1 glutamate decarboxylase [Secundilactobacillus paracollinoides]ANZ68366.1 glutamate decarboxylase [Secundilactobacillus paracollinoides]